MDKVGFQLLTLSCNLKKVLPLANSHMVHFITRNLFENVLPIAIQEEIMTLNFDELNSIVLKSFKNAKYNVNEKAPNLAKFLHEVQKLSLKQSDLCFPLETLCEKLSRLECLGECSFHVIKNLMSMKKSYEVEIMSSISAALAKNEKCTHIVDIGGGKCYLGCVLALKHKLKVLSIDSSFIASKGAAKKLPKFEKLWDVLCKKSVPENKCNSTTNKISNVSNHEKFSQLCKLATLSIVKDTDVRKLIENNFPGNEIGNIMLVGLHTCGNLAASSLSLFANNPKYIRCIVNVGCCYHLINEEFDTTPPWIESEAQDGGVGFPMSSLLRETNFVLGRNARMLAAQPPDRISNDGMVQTESLFYRALLEVYLERKLSPLNGLPHFRIGKISKKCSSFTEYVHKSIKRLGLDIQVDDEELQQMYDSYQESRKQLHAFFLLRLAVAPAVEAIIMLDRLLYLHEQGVEDAYLTQLFNPIVSPRCFAIIAFNKQTFS